VAVQNTRGQLAKALTGAQFADILKLLVEELLKLKRGCKAFQDRSQLKDERLLVVMDRCPAHLLGVELFLATDYAKKVHVEKHVEFVFNAPMSPETNKVVEHYHAAATGAFRRALMASPAKAWTIDELVPRLKDHWFAFGKGKYLEKVRDDFRSLRQTYELILEAHGGRIDSHFA
jgi:hypothetical protein